MVRYCIFLFISLYFFLYFFTAEAAVLTNDSAINTHWAYKGNIGPGYWGRLNPSFALCDKGKMQSPINITKKTTSEKNRLGLHYQVEPLKMIENGTTKLMMGNEKMIINTGHTVQLNFTQQPTKDFIRFAGNPYALV